MKKGKITVTITLSIICFTLTYVMFTQFKTVQRTDFDELALMEESELKQELTRIKTEYKDIETKLDETNSKIKEYKEKSEKDDEVYELLEKELKEVNIVATYTDVAGEGIEVTIEDNEEMEEAIINNRDLVDFVNTLKESGAEAISINGQRVNNDSYFVDITAGVIKMNGKRLSSPYVIKAIGKKSDLESSFSKKLKVYENIGFTTSLIVKDNVEIEKSTSNINFEYAENNIEEE